MGSSTFYFCLLIFYLISLLWSVGVFFCSLHPLWCISFCLQTSRFFFHVLLVFISVYVFSMSSCTIRSSILMQHPTSISSMRTRIFYCSCNSLSLTKGFVTKHNKKSSCAIKLPSPPTCLKLFSSASIDIALPCIILLRAYSATWIYVPAPFSSTSGCNSSAQCYQKHNFDFLAAIIFILTSEFNFPQWLRTVAVGA